MSSLSLLLNILLAFAIISSSKFSTTSCLELEFIIIPVKISSVFSILLSSGVAKS